jgi:hypothetical protein
MHSQTSATRLQASQRRVEALQLRLAGQTYAQLGQQLGCSPQRAHVIIKAEMDQLKQDRQELAEEMLQLELDRLDHLLAGLWAEATGGNCKAVEAVLKVIDRQIRLLGLDAPTRTEAAVSVSSLAHMTDAEVMEEARRLGIPVGDEAAQLPAPEAGSR